MSPGGGVLILFLLAYSAAAQDMMPENLMSSILPSRNESAVDFPSPPLRFKKIAKALMMRCYKQGYQVPSIMEALENSSLTKEEINTQPPLVFLQSLLSSFKSLEDTEQPDEDPKWNAKGDMRNCTSLPKLIGIMRNASDGPRCFIRALLAPLSWMTLMRKGSDVDLEDYRKLLWASKPLLEVMPPSRIMLPQTLERPRLALMMKLLSEVYSSLSEEQRDTIQEWLKERIAETDFSCTLTQPESTSMFKPGQPTTMDFNGLNSGSKPPKDDGGDGQGSSKNGRKREEAQTPDRDRPSGGEKQRPGQANQSGDDGKKPDSDRPKGDNGQRPSSSDRTRGQSDLKRCSPNMPWLKPDVLKMMGRFLSRVPLKDLTGIPKTELCDFYQAPEFSSSFQAEGDLKPSLGKRMCRRLRKECLNDDQKFQQQTERLGTLICFCDDLSSLNVTLSQLVKCENPDMDKVKKKLVKKMLSAGDMSTTSEWLTSLGTGASALPPSTLDKFSPDVLKDTLSSLGKTKWTRAQAKTLAMALLKDKKNVSGQELLSLGTLVKGLDTDILRKVDAKELLGNKGFMAMSERLSPLQKTALLRTLQDDVNATVLVKQAPDSLISFLTLPILEKAQLNSMDELEGHKWTRAQSFFLLKKILASKKVRAKQIRQMGEAVRGVACDMIDGISQDDTMETAQELSNSSNWLSKTQVQCAVHKLFDILEKERPNYFASISDSELQDIPALYLIHLQPEKIGSLPDAVCPCFLEKMKEAKFSSLHPRAPQRAALTDKALACLGKNVLELSPEDVLSLGPILCELPPSWVSSLAPDVVNSTLMAQASCKHIPRRHRQELYALVVQTFGDPSTWTEDDMDSLGILLLLNDSAMTSLPYKPWLKRALSSLKDRISSMFSESAQEEFDLSALRWKLFSLVTGSAGEPVEIQRRKRRDVVEPTELRIEELGETNVLWSPPQLASMSLDTFRESVSTLGEITSYTTEQLSVLRMKAIEAFGPVASLNDSQTAELGCVTQSFTEEELQSLNISSVDTLETFQPCRFSPTQREAVYQAFLTKTGLSVSQLGELEIVGLGQFICGLNPNDTGKLQSTVFKGAVEAIGRAPCQLPLLEKLKDRAVAAFGEPSSWSEAEVSIMGNLIAGLNSLELQNLLSSVMPFISKSAIPLIPPKHLAKLQASKLRALGHDNAKMVTEMQRAQLSQDQKAALDEAMGLSYSRSAEQNAMPPENGAPKLCIMGFAVLMQPFIFMLLGFFS